MTFAFWIALALLILIVGAFFQMVNASPASEAPPARRVPHAEADRCPECRHAAHPSGAWGGCPSGWRHAPEDQAMSGRGHAWRHEVAPSSGCLCDVGSVAALASGIKLPHGA